MISCGRGTVLPLLLLMQPTMVWQPPLHPSSQRYSSCETILLGENKLFPVSKGPYFSEGRQTKTQTGKKKKIFLIPWHLLVSSQLVTRTVEKEFLLNFSACPQDTELKTHTSRACPKAVGPSTSLRDGNLFGSSLRVRMSLG